MVGKGYYLDATCHSCGKSWEFYSGKTPKVGVKIFLKWFPDLQEMGKKFKRANGNRYRSAVFTCDKCQKENKKFKLNFVKEKEKQDGYTQIKI
jgi:hypothetical protein